MISEREWQEKREDGHKHAAVPKLKAGYTEISWQEYNSATKGSHVTRGRKWRYSSNANVGSSSAPSAPAGAVKTVKKCCENMIQEGLPFCHL